MKILKNLFTKDEELSLEEKEIINNIIDKKNNPNQDTGKVDLKEFVSHLNLEQINELRELIEKREDELHELYGLKDERVTPRTEYKGEIEIQEPIHEEDLNNKTYDDIDTFYNEQSIEIKSSLSEEDEPISQNPKFTDTKIDTPGANKDIDYEDIDSSNTDDNLEENSLKAKLDNTDDDIYLKLIKIFGKENIFKETKQNLNAKLPKDKDILCLGIRKSDAFNKDSDEVQNTWFIQNIKQLDELAHFKMVKSLSNNKELFWDKETNPVLIVYKSTNILKTKDEFEF